MDPKNLRIAVVGATGAVGREMMRVLEDRKFRFADLVPFASQNSVGKPVRVVDREFKCQALKPGCFAGVNIAFFDASDEVSREWVLQAAESGTWVVDSSAAYRMEADVPLLVPEVNGVIIDRLVAKSKAPSGVSPRERILAGPNCTTVQLVIALKPLAQNFGLKRVVVSTYQAVSGAGTAATQELRTQTRTVLEGGVAKAEIFKHPIAFNCIPQIGGFKADGYTSEEHKIMAETRKILDLPALKIVATSVRVPTLSGHGESVFVEFERAGSLDQVRDAMRAQGGLELQDEPSKFYYPMGLTSEHRDPVFVGRLRMDPSVVSGASFWVVSDNLRKGAALNALQIGERIISSL